MLFSPMGSLMMYNHAVMTITQIPLTLIELGIVIISLALLDRLARRIGISAVPLFLLVGLAFGHGGLLPLEYSEDFLHIGSEIGVLLLLFTLGLEYTGDQLSRGLRKGLPDGIVDLIINFPPGFLMARLMGWSSLSAWLLGGITYISSSGIISKVLAEKQWMQNQETKSIISILVIEDLVMAIYLPLTIVLLAGQTTGNAAISVVISLAAVAVMLFIAIRFGETIGHLVAHVSDEVVMLSILGLILVVAGLAQQVQISAPVGAFLVGVALTGPIAERTRRILSPLRDLFAAIFFLHFGLQIDTSILLPVLLPALGLGFITTLSKLLSGWWSARRAGAATSGRLRAGSILVTRGEFSILIAGMGVTAGLDPQLGALTAAYVLLLSILGPLMAQGITPLGTFYKNFQAGAFRKDKSD